MRNALPTFFSRYWIAIAVIIFALLSTYTSDATFAQNVPPTPDVNTVPRPDAIITPTNTPFPSPTPVGGNGLPSGGGSPRPNPTATRTPDNNDDDQETTSNDTGSAAPSNGNNGSTAPSAPAAPENAVNGTISTVTLNVRRAPNTGANIVDTLFMGEAVQILGRDSGGNWWYVCCGTGAGRPGWVSAQFVTFDNAGSDVIAAIPVTANTNAAAVGEAAALTGTNTLTVPLVLEMRPNPAFVWQGRTVQLQFVVHNRSNQAMTNVQLRNDLPPTLRYLTTSVSDQAAVATTGTAADGVIFAINWPEIAAGEQLTATVTVQVASDVANGDLIDNLAVVNVDEGGEALAGITFAMPPGRPPRFR